MLVELRDGKLLLSSPQAPPAPRGSEELSRVLIRNPPLPTTDSTEEYFKLTEHAIMPALTHIT